MELSIGILQSSHEHSVLLRDLIIRQNEQTRVLQEHAGVLDEIRLNASTGGSTSSSTVPTRPSSAGGPPGYRDSSDNSSTMSKRSTFSLRLGRSRYMDDLKSSRAYKRLRRFGLGIDSSSVLSLDTACSAGNWSILSDMTLGDLSISQIAVLNLPIDLADISNPEPFQEPSSTDRNLPRGKRSSRGRIHNAIGNGNGFVVRALLAMGIDIEELDSNGRTPLVHAAVKCQEAICKLLLGKGASVEALNAFTRCMDPKERSELLDQSLENAMSEGLRSETTIRLLLSMALGGDDNQSLSQINVATDMQYGLALCAIAQLELRVVVEVDIEGPTGIAQSRFGLGPEVNDYETLEDICRVVLDNTNIEAMKKMAVPRIAVSMHDLVKKAYQSILQLLSLIDSRDAEGWTPLASAAFNSREDLCEFLVGKGCSLCLDTEFEQKEQLKPKLSCNIIDASQRGHKTVLQLLLDMGADVDKRNADGETALLEAVYNDHLSCIKILIGRGADVTIPNGAGRNVLHRVAWESTDSETMKFLLDVVEARKLVDMKDSKGDTPLHNCGYSNKQSAVLQLENAKMLLQAGASLTIKNNAEETSYECARSRKRKELAKHLWSQLSPEQRATEIPLPSDW